MVWMGIVTMMLIGTLGGLAILVLLWRGKKSGLAILTIVTVAMAMLLSLMFLHVRLGSREESGYGVPVQVWAIGLRLFAIVQMGVVLASVLYLVWRFFAWLGSADPAGAAVNPEERKRILGMVEQGKMTGTEGAELLDALGKSSALRGQQTFGRLDVAILVGTAIVVLGFFLRWVIVSSTWQLEVMRQAFGSDTLTMSFAGYDVGAVGWAVLICAILAALLIFITPKEYLYKLVLLQVLSVCVGLALAASVWWRAGSHVGAGAVICCLGFVFALIASGMKLRALGR